MERGAATRDDTVRPLEVANRREGAAMPDASRTEIGGAVTPDPAIVDPAEHNVVFTSLVTGDRDIVGLVAYSIYKQNKYDWLQAYSRLQGRMPNAEEAQAYLFGESTPRRLATYRHLAEAVLDGRGPDVPGAPAGEAVSRDRAARPAASAPGTPARRPARFQVGAGTLLGLGVALVALLLLFWLLRSGAPLPPATPAR